MVVTQFNVMMNSFKLYFFALMYVLISSQRWQKWMNLRFEVLTAVNSISAVVFWVLTPCSLVGGYKHFEGECQLRVKDQPEQHMLSQPRWPQLTNLFKSQKAGPTHQLTQWVAAYLSPRVKQSWKACQGQETAEPYLHYPINLHGVVLKKHRGKTLHNHNNVTRNASFAHTAFSHFFWFVTHM
jgi:hypothetical protein